MTIQEAIEILRNPDDNYGVDENGVMLPDCEYAQALKTVVNLSAVLEEWVNMSVDGALCCGCNSGKGKHCAECGIRETEICSKKLLGIPEQVDEDE
jgi:hypothetical protein